MKTMVNQSDVTNMNAVRATGSKFSAAFKSVIGITPPEYRKSIV